LQDTKAKTANQQTKSKVKDIAKDLIKLYSERTSASGFAFSPDTYLQHQLEASFMFEDTPDQLLATEQVKSDMEQPYPMDRLVCGDVGFGKTEVAIRAAFKAVTDGKQVAVLVPTTILALQHYHTISERLSDFPVKTEFISRLKTPAQTKQILTQLQEGSLDIIIGTHRLLAKDVVFKDLGLLVIDEEQKFGVSAKEKLKFLKTHVDTLTLTATPIPRTLQFSLMGARDLSIIQTPPANRLPIHTEVQFFDEEIIGKALDRELDRGGQLFFVHNRIRDIEQVAEKLEQIRPGIRIAIGHGQLSPRTMEKILLDFISGDYDLLLSTSIIENGIDIPNANTIIINRAQYFGLSDLHQMRGRVGRSNRKAYCYLLVPEGVPITEDARRRLQAMESFTELGSGFNIAMQDLDIRGHPRL
jgi:transcription-repair coupling factor (superfamily II helicase)